MVPYQQHKRGEGGERFYVVKGAPAKDPPAPTSMCIRLDRKYKYSVYVLAERIDIVPAVRVVAKIFHSTDT